MAERISWEAEMASKATGPGLKQFSLKKGWNGSQTIPNKNRRREPGGKQITFLQMIAES